MLIQRLNKKFLFSSTVIAGLTAVMAAGGASAQTTPQPPTSTPQSSDSSPGANEVVQQSPDRGAPEQVAPDPAVVNQPEGEEARNQSGEPVADDEADVEAVVVTGSRIRRNPANAPTPLIQVGREEVLQSGEPNIVDFLADIPALQGSQVPEDTTGGFLNAGGLSLLNLRDLGAVRTLVLVDGRRQVGSAPGSLSVDVDTIPSLLIENVEVVTGGQSALYGADAVSGVVNFILRRNFEGIEVDGTFGQINQDGERYNRRISGLIGQNFLNDRLNVYAFAEYQKADEVQNLDLDWARRGYGFLLNDADPGVGNDGVLDNQFRGGGLRSSLFSRGGTLVLANQPFPSPVTDPDTPFINCGAAPANPARTSFSANCSAVRPDNPGSIFVFDASGRARPFNFGSEQQTAGFSRPLHIGGDGLNIGTESQQSRVPESEAFRYQTGVNLDVTDGIQLFAEAKFVRELTTTSTSPTFFQIVVADPRPGERPASFLLSSSALINIGLDNAYLNQNSPELVNAIRNNRRPRLGAGGVQIGTVLDPRAFLTVQGPTRRQDNERELTRYVAGVRGDRERLGFIDNFAYEIGYTYGEVENRNREAAVDIERFQFSLDAVRDVNNVTGKGANAIVCRVQVLTAGGRTITDEIRGGGRTLNANSPQVRDCVPTNIFGADLRADANNEHISGGGGRPGATPEQLAYFAAAINVRNRNQQQNLLTFASGEILDGFLPAGPIGIAAGYEYREEKTSGIGRSAETGDRRLFLNVGPDFPEVSYDANEFFAEVRVPLLRDLPFVETLEVSGAYRKSDYSTVGEVTTHSLQGLYRPNRTFLFRTTYGQATRIPNLGENFAPGTQTFANGFVDPCDANIIRGIANPQDRANRRANCQALLGPGYSPGTDAPNTGTSIIYTSGVPGRNAGNPFLIPEDSRSYTYGLAFTPRFIRGLSLTADYFDIQITDVISAVTAQNAAINCVAGTTLNPQACATITRAGPTPPPGTGASPFAVIDFIQGSLNFAALEAKGVDFTGRYGTDLAEIGVPTFFGRDPGRVDYSLRGTYLIRRENFLNFADPGDAQEFDAQVGFPRVRLLSTLTYSPTDRLSVAWNWDYQTSQEILDSDVFLFNGDTRDAQFAETGAFNVHSFNVRYELTDNFIIRAGVVNAFDNDPPVALGSNTSADNFDLFGRRFFIGGNMKFGAAADPN